MHSQLNLYSCAELMTTHKANDRSYFLIKHKLSMLLDYRSLQVIFQLFFLKKILKSRRLQKCDHYSFALESLLTSIIRFRFYKEKAIT